VEDHQLIAPETKGRSIEEFEKALKRTGTRSACDRLELEMPV
jgi:hypothetical protein